MIPIPCNLFVLEIQVAGLHCRKGGWSGRTLQRSTLGCILPLLRSTLPSQLSKYLASLAINAIYYGDSSSGQAIQQKAWITTKSVLSH